VVGSWSPAALIAEFLVLVVTMPTMVRLISSIRPTERLDTRGSGSGIDSSISVVIPARNEATRISPLLEALHLSADVVEVIVVDDESTDSTAAVARKLGAQVVPVPPRPNGWVGKTWALQQGTLSARGTWVVTLDADTRPDPALPRALVRWAEGHGVALTTVAGSFECPTLGAQFIHPAMLTSLVYRYGRPTSNDASRPIANGQCMAFRREDAMRDDYFESVKGELIEDVALARLLRTAGESVAMVDGTDFLQVRMFDDFGTTIRGWGRSISMANVERRGRLLAQLVALGCAQVLPIAFIVSGVAPVAGSILLALRVGTLVGTAKTYPHRRWTYWASPLGDVIAWVVVARGVIHHFLGVAVEWRGRSYGSRPSGV
jgi:dolichol-phosphate mannosyltransferase